MRMVRSVMLLALLAAPSAVFAQASPIDARFEAGRALRRDHRDAEALSHFQQLYAEAHEPRALAQVGLAQAALGRWAEAEMNLSQALANPDAWIAENRAGGAMLDQQAQRIAAHLGSLDVVSDAPGAEVWVGGQRVGTIPLARPLRLEAGRVTFEVRAAGYAPTQRVADVIAGGMSRESVSLTRALSSVEGPSQGVGGTFFASGPTAQGPSNTTRTLAWVAAGGAVVFLAGGAVAYALGAPAADRWNDDAQCLRPGMTREQQCSSDGSLARTMSALEITGFVAGGALAAASAALFYVSTPRGGAALMALSCGGGPGEFGVACGARF